MVYFEAERCVSFQYSMPQIIGELDYAEAFLLK